MAPRNERKRLNTGNLLPVMVTYRKVVACLSCPVGSGTGWGIDHYSTNERESE